MRARQRKKNQKRLLRALLGVKKLRVANPRVLLEDTLRDFLAKDWAERMDRIIARQFAEPS